MLDFKFEISDSKKIARTLVAFANTDGGRLLIGVKDNGSISGIRSEEEKYMIDSYLDEVTSDVQDRITVLSGYNRDKRLEKKLYNILNKCKVDISYGKKFNNIFNNLDDIKEASIKLKELDDEYKKIISG